MSVCPGCGRCRECGHPAPVKTYPLPYPVPVNPWPTGPQPYQPIWVTSPNIYGGATVPGTTYQQVTL